MSHQSIPQWKESEYRGYTSVVGENEWLRVEIVPGRGGKLVSFRNMETGKEWAYRSDDPWTPLQYGMRFEDGDRSGWDEMFPTILPSPCPDYPWQGASYPDHGEVWTLPWLYKLQSDSVEMWVNGIQTPYLFSKSYSLSGKQLNIRYRVHNPTPFPISYMWCAHFLLAVKQGMTLKVEPQLDTVQYQYSHNNRMTPKPYGRSAYPLAHGRNTLVDLSVVEADEGLHAEKFWFEGELSKGIAGIYDPESGESLTYSFSPDDVPYLAVWANYGVFTDDYTLALEPATGFLDDLYIASVMQKVKKVQPYCCNEWDFAVSVDPDVQQTIPKEKNSCGRKQDI